MNGPFEEGSVRIFGSCVSSALILCSYIFACLVYASCPYYMEFVCLNLLQACAFDFQIIILLKNMNLCHCKRIKRITSMQFVSRV